MSLGIGAYARKILEDDNTVIYEYGNYNFNLPGYRNEEHTYDGTITISKECFVEPEIHEKLKKLPSGRRKIITKKIPVPVDYEKLIKEGFIVVDNCSYCWELTANESKTDVMVLHLLYKIFHGYQMEGRIPNNVSFDS